MTRRIGILLFPEVEELDFVAPLEVLDLVNRFAQDALQIATFSLGEPRVKCAHGLQIIADYTLGDLPDFDILLVPGGPGSRQQMNLPATLDFVARQAERSELVASVCTGALILAGAGLLQGKRATTHFSALDLLQSFEGVEVVRRRFVHHGNVVTSGGITAGLDMALYLVEKLFGGHVRDQVARQMEYDG